MDMAIDIYMITLVFEKNPTSDSRRLNDFKFVLIKARSINTLIDEK